MTRAYYNEFDRQKAAWLRELIKEGHIADGDVDERSIKDITPGDLAGYRQCHFFAGIGVWSYALRAAGWPDDREVWTGSCPCQGFSVAGKKGGFADPRHLWPDWFRLIAQCRPRTIFGEQSASKDALTWLDLVYADLEKADYTRAALDICAAGFGAPHIRQRLYFVAHPTRSTRFGAIGRGDTRTDTGGSGSIDFLAHSHNPERRSEVAPLDTGRPGPTNGFWANADWLRCTDGKWRPTRSGSQPLATKSPCRVGRLRGYGDAIVAEAAKGFIEAYLEVEAAR